MQDAHSLYLETLGELGIVGFVLLVGAFACGLATAARRLLRAVDADRVTLAAVSATFVALSLCDVSRRNVPVRRPAARTARRSWPKTFVSAVVVP